MGKLEELRKFVSERFQEAESKESIDMLSQIQNHLDNVEKEQAALESKNVELLKSYKELVSHTSFEGTKTEAPTDPVDGVAPDFDTIIAQFIQK